MRILCVIDSLGSGGAQRQLVNLAISFKEKGHNVSFLVYHYSPFYYDILHKKGIEVIEVIEPSYLKRIFRMRKAIRSGGYDSVLSFLEASNFMCELAGFPTRKWCLVVGERSANPTILKSFRLKIFRWFHLFATAVVANSHENLKLIKKVNPFLANKKLNVIYNLIDLEKWRPYKQKYEFRKNKKFNLVVVASHQYLKNLNGLIEAVKLLNDFEKNQIIINWYGGESVDNSKIEALKKIENYNLSDIFNFHEPTIEIAAKVNEADALGLFSFYEGLPNVVCEAMVNSKPVIASSVSDIPLLLNENFIFDPKDYADMSKKFRALLELDEVALSKVGKRNRQLILEKLDNKTIVNSYLNILSKKSFL